MGSTLFALASATLIPLASDLGIGTGFFYNRNGDFFTNGHVVSHCREDAIRARTSDGAWHPVQLLAVDKDYDLAAGTISKPVDAFASIRTHGDTGFVSVPDGVEDIFSAGFSAPEQNNLELQTKWGQVQPVGDPNRRPFVQIMRMDAYPGASGSAILGYDALLVGILFASSKYPVIRSDSMRAAGYGDKWIFFYNNNAIVEFANRHELSYSAWGHSQQQSPMFVAEHARRISVLLVCQPKQKD